jgi:hypothetical protein
MVGIEVRVPVIKVVAPEFKLSGDFWRGLQVLQAREEQLTNI